MQAQRGAISYSKLRQTLMILILEMTLLLSVFGDDSILSADIPSEEVTDLPCRDLEPAFRRLRNIPEHLHPEALQSGSCRVGDDANKHVWQCHGNEEEQEGRYQDRSDFHLGLYCEDVELLFSLYNSNEMDRHPNDFIGFDYQSWCKCPYAASNSTGKCDLCSDGMIIKPSLLHSVFNSESTDDERFRLTCAQASEYAHHITDERRCSDTLGEARVFCCQSSTSTITQTHKIEFEDVQMTLAIIVAVTSVSTLAVFGLLQLMECIDFYFFSRKETSDDDYTDASSDDSW